MQITQAFVDEFLRLVRAADPGARLQDKTSSWQRESSLLPLYQKLCDAQQHQAPIEFDPIVKNLIAAIKPDKQLKYGAALKYVEKTMLGQGSKIFHTLREHGEKLSKAQQRYTIPLLQGDAGHGLCLQMALLWLQEQFRFVVWSTKFPRLADGPVTGSQAAVKLTEAALGLKTGGGRMDAQAASVGLVLEEKRWQTSFQTLNRSFSNNEDVQALLIEFWHGQHAIALCRDGPGAFKFFDANAGSYRIEAANLQAFLLDYNNVCLPKKWAGYALQAGESFTGVYAVTKA